MTPMLLGLVFLGGGVGAACRHLTSWYVGQRYTGVFPLGTCLINIAGSLALGFVAGILGHSGHAPGLTALLATGFLGGFTTFSTYALEAVVLAGDRALLTAMTALLVPMAASLPAAALGGLLARAVGS